MSYEERQDDEVDFLCAVFPGDCIDLRQNDKWKIHRPPEILLTLVPQKSMGGSALDQRLLSINLHARYTTDYPDSPPELKLEDPHGLSPDQVKELTEEIGKLASDRTGEVMMLEIAQAIQEFLHRHDRPPISLYEEMVKRQHEKEKEEQQRIEAEREACRIKEEEEHRQIEEEIERKKAELQISDEDSEEVESEEDLVSSLKRQSPASPDTRLDSSDTHDKTTPPSVSVVQSDPVRVVEGVRGRVVKDVRGGGRRRSDRDMLIHKGRLLGESSSCGHAVYVGMNTTTGDLLAVYEWSLQCRQAKRGDTKRLKQVASIQQEYDSYQSRGITHPNLVQYLGMSHAYSESTNKISVEVVMEYVGGGSVCSLLRNPDCGPIRGETHRYYSKLLLEALSYLHSQGVVHNDIRPSLVFLETGGSIKLGGFSIIKRLADLHKAMNTHVRPASVATLTIIEDDTVSPAMWPPGAVEIRGGKKGDVLKLGMLLLCLSVGKLDIGYPPTIPDDLPDTLRDFLVKCTDSNEQRRFPAHELLHHPYISPSPHTSHPHTSSTPVTHIKHTSAHPQLLPTEMRFQRSDSIVGSPTRSCLTGRSRLETEFEELENLGSGGFGDVMKVRNHLDGRLYALKKIVMRDIRMMTRITREVEMLSQMNHENVVRYYNAWIETYSEDQFKKLSGTDLSVIHSDSSYNSHSRSQLESDSIVFENNSSSGSSSSDGEDDEVEISGFNLDQSTSALLTKEDDSEVVFMEDFSDSSGEGRNVLGELESQVMKSSLTKFRMPTTESSDTIVFADSSVMIGGASTTQPIAIKKGDRRRERRKQKPDGRMQILYIQMEYCENETLRQLIDAGNLHCDEDLVWRLFREIVEGLEHIHSKGMIHRDLKPGNVFLNSSGHIKIGDFGLATSHKHPVNRQSSIVQTNNSLDVTDMMEDTRGETGLVGTAMYVSPELLKPAVKYTQKVDIYSLGIIFFEMCHAPLTTGMERYKMLVDLRKKEIIIPLSFDKEKEKQVEVIRWLLNHNPHDRPTSKQLLQSPLLPLKMEDEELQEVLLRTLQATNSTRYRHLIDELFVQERSRVQEYSYFVDPPDTKRRSVQNLKKNKFSFFYSLLQQLINSRLVAIFSRHGATPLTPSLLGPMRHELYDRTSTLAQFIDRSGIVVTLPPDLRVPFARYVVQQDISYLKRFCISPVYNESKVLGFHPKEHLECQFDIVSPSQESLVPDAEVMYIVSEVISELPGFQEVQYSIVINHTSLLASVLSYCSIPTDKHREVWSILHKITSGAVKFSDLDKQLNEKSISLSPLASKTLLKFVSSEVLFESKDGQSLFEPLSRDKTSNVGSEFSLAWQEMSAVVEHFRQFGAKEHIFISPGLCPSSFSHYSGVVFQYMEVSSGQTSSRKSRRSRRVPLAIGGRYDRLLGEFRYPGKQPAHPNVSVVGVTVMWEVLMTRALSAYQQGNCPLVTKCSVLVCWLGRESLQRECAQLLHDLWTQGIAADVLYESMELDSVEDIQEFCKKNFIQHMVLLTDRTLFFERKQVKVRSLESGKIVEKVMTTSELMDFLLQRQHTVERSDSIEMRDSSRVTGSTDLQSNLLPPVNVNIIATGKLPGHTKRRYHDQAVTKLIPLLQNFSSKQPLEVLVVDLKVEHLCSLAAEVNKLMGINEQDFSTVIRTVCERHTDISKKYTTKVCESIKEFLVNKKGVPVVFLYSHSAECCQTVLNSLESLTTTS